MTILAKGFTAKEIAEKLVISPGTAHSHRINLMTKLGLNNRRDLSQYAHQHGLIRDE